jgi:hypothetical protein
METQLKVITQMLINYGVVDNVHCFHNKITYRLGDRIFNLRKLIQQESKKDYEYVKKSLLWTDEREDTDRNCHYWVSKGCQNYLKRIIKKLK